MAALPPGVVNNNTLSVDPRFTNSVNFVPRADWPLREQSAGRLAYTTNQQPTTNNNHHQPQL